MEMPKLLWDYGTGYDLFVSLYILHQPGEFGLRPSWAAGVRQRLPVEEREILERANSIVHFPLCWVYALPGPKDCARVLQGLRDLAPEERIPTLAQSSGLPEPASDILETVAGRGAWGPEDRDALRDAYRDTPWSPSNKELDTHLDIWLDLETFGTGYLAALQAYWEVFFAEEAERIRPALQTALQDAQQLAEQLDFPDLIEKVSRGVRFEEGFQVESLVMLPSYWITPLVVHGRVEEGVGAFLFGARPEDDSLVPGALVPDGMLRGLKTLADPTRLRILRYLSQETLSPSQLARRLRLRAPTVTHHLSALRLAGLVYLTLGEKKRKIYATRTEAISATFSTLEEFLSGETKEIQQDPKE